MHNRLIPVLALPWRYSVERDLSSQSSSAPPPPAGGHKHYVATENLMQQASPTGQLAPRLQNLGSTRFRSRRRARARSGS